jgi:hypothetical protein
MQALPWGLAPLARRSLSNRESRAQEPGFRLPSLKITFLKPGTTRRADTQPTCPQNPYPAQSNSALGRRAPGMNSLYPMMRVKHWATAHSKPALCRCRQMESCR